MQRRWRWLFLVLVVVAGLVVEVLYDPLQWAINSTRIAWYRVELPLARARWERAGIADYQVEVRGGYPLECVVSARLITRQGELVEIQALPRFPGPAPEVFIGPSSGWPDCKSSNYTIPLVFDLLDEVLGGVNPSFDQVKISFDWKYGYVKHYEVNSGYRFGLLTQTVGDCCSQFDFENFEVLRRSD